MSEHRDGVRPLGAQADRNDCIAGSVLFIADEGAFFCQRQSARPCLTHRVSSRMFVPSLNHCRFGLTILRFRFVASVCVVAEAVSQSLTMETDR